ncbi:MAG: C-GCAxxG-C-C family protein [Bacillota bacterium]
MLTVAGRELGINILPEMQKMASGFGGGMSAGCMCGAVWGMGSVINLSLDEANTLQKNSLNRRVFNQFKELFGSACCHQLNPFMDFKGEELTLEVTDPEQQKKCTKYVLKAIGMVQGEMEDYKGRGNS